MPDADLIKVNMDEPLIVKVVKDNDDFLLGSVSTTPEKSKREVRLKGYISPDRSVGRKLLEITNYPGTVELRS